MSRTDENARKADEVSKPSADHERRIPEHSVSETPRTSPGAGVRPRVMHVHKGDVGRPDTNEEIYQGSKMRELK